MTVLPTPLTPFQKRMVHARAKFGWWAAQWLSPANWFYFWPERGYAHWCGRFLIVHMPENWSLLAGRGRQGWWLFRCMERGHDIVALDKASRKARRDAR